MVTSILFYCQPWFLLRCLVPLWCNFIDVSFISEMHGGLFGCVCPSFVAIRLKLVPFYTFYCKFKPYFKTELIGFTKRRGNLLL